MNNFPECPDCGQSFYNPETGQCFAQSCPTNNPAAWCNECGGMTEQHPHFQAGDVQSCKCEELRRFLESNPFPAEMREGQAFRVAISNGNLPYAYGSATDVRCDYADHTVGWAHSHKEAIALLVSAWEQAEEIYQKELERLS